LHVIHTSVKSPFLFHALFEDADFILIYACKKKINGKVRGRLYKKKKLTENPLIVDYFFLQTNIFK